MTRILLNFGLCLALCGALALAASAGCHEKNGRYPVSGSCDAYIECRDGVPEEKTCPDGLLFNEKTALGYPCGYPIEVECKQSARLQSAQPTDECPHQFGYFRMGDSSHCGQFLNCVDGRAYIVDCPEGLAWNPETYQCDWPDQVKDCDAEAFLGFKCPDIARSELLGEEEYRFYSSPNDCQRYFICINGKPRLLNCGEERAFNPEINACDGIENVTCSGLRPQIKSQPLRQAPQRGQASKIASSYAQPGRQQQAQRGGAFQQQTSTGNAFQQQAQRGNAFQQQAQRGNAFQQQAQRGNAFQQQAQKGNAFQQQAQKGNAFQQQPQRNNAFQQQAQRGNAFQQQTQRGNTFQQQQLGQRGGAFQQQQSGAYQQQGNTGRPNYASAITCTEKNARYASPDQCDAYIECLNGVPQDKLCPDGLLFNQRTETEGDCTYSPFSSCIEPRTRLQPAQPTADCPRQFGFYKIGDASQCGQYKNCAHGEASITKCPEGLAFNPATYQCDWPDQVEECNAEAFLGFTCPIAERTEEEISSQIGEVLRYYRKPDSCRQYFVCVNNRPRLYTCGKYLAFNEETGLCDFYTNVPECYQKLRDISKVPELQQIKEELLKHVV